MVEIGVDCEEISRFHKMISSRKLSLKIFTEKELSYCTSKSNPEQHLAVRYTGKEAVIKSLSPLGIDLHLNEVEILNDKKGIPRVNIKRKNVFCSIKLSLSHSRNYAFAVALTEEGEENKH